MQPDEAVAGSAPAITTTWASGTLLAGSPTDSGPVQLGAASGWRDEAPRYDLREVLGRGGMGEVYLGGDRRIGREVALKTVRNDEGTGEPALDRFLWEACIQGQLEHPSIVPVYDLGRSPTGEFYFTMKRVRGRTLRSILQAPGDDPLTQRRLLAAFVNVCLAIAFAHSRSVVHRDLKPENIMLGDFGEVYVLDWGLAKVLGTRDAPSEALRALPARGETAAGALLGTLGYMAPEQLRSSRSVDERADIYALGAILFEIVTLRRLHEGDHAAAIARSTLYGVENHARQRLSSAHAPDEIAELCLRATATAREHRPPSARELAEAVERHLNHDRNLEMRGQMARLHAASADDAAMRALGAEGSHDSRRQALREASRALALDPSHRQALATMMRLLMQPPEAPPPEVEKQLEEEREERARGIAKLVSVLYLVFLGYLPILLWMGVRDWRMFAVLYGSVAAIGIVGALTARLRAGADRMLSVLAIAGAVVAAATALVFGPFIVAPAFAAVTMIATALVVDRGPFAIAALGCLAVLVPWSLEWIGLLPAAHAFVEGGILLRPRMTSLPEVPSLLTLALSTVTTIGIGVLAASRIRRELLTAQRGLMLQGWQLKQLVPAEHEAEASPEPSEGPSEPAAPEAVEPARTGRAEGEACLSEEEIAEFLTDALDEGERDRVEAHIDRCEACRRLVSLLAARSTRSGS